jgi:hypothetical protein
MPHVVEHDRAGILKVWKEDNNIRSLEWPAQSPDLNPIENLRHDLATSVRRYNSTNLRHLEAYLIQAWAQIQSERCEALVLSMLGRMRAVISARGGYTKY